jgi:hypothetical protein
MAEGSWFVYRSPYEGPSGRRLRRLPDPSPLAWFQRMWQATADEEGFERDADAYDWVQAILEADLSGRVYGLSSLFCSNPEDPPLPAERRDPLPASTWQELRDLLRQRLYVEGDPRENIRVDQHSVRAATDDDEVDLAYYFLDDVAAHSDRAAYLMLQDWRLPAAAGKGGDFREPSCLQRPAARHSGAGVTYLVVLGPDERFAHSYCELPPLALDGVQLPELAGYLRSARPGAAEPPWPHALLVLRALVAPTDRRIGPSLRRYARAVGRLQRHDAAEPVQRTENQDHATAHQALATLLRAPPPAAQGGWSEPDERRSRVHDDQHLAQALVHVHDLFGYERWYLFDDLWAAGHPELAASLLRYAGSWDPLGVADGPAGGT